MKKNLFNKPSRLSFQTALYAGLGTGIAAIALGLFITRLSLGAGLLAGLLLGVFTFLLVYYISYRLHTRRMEALNRIIRDIARKQFGEYQDINHGGHDELGYLLKQTIRASKTVEREIQRLNRIENYRKEFIGDISHELKTPIFAVQGFIETLLNGALEDEEVNRKFLEKAMRNVNRLTYLTKDLMEISKLETGELKSDVQDIYLENIASEIVESLQYKAKKEDISLQTKNFDGSIPVRADRNQIKQVLINLTENAIKYNKPKGTVTIGTKPFPQNAAKILVYVKDTGIGIDQQNIKRVTERFFRVDKSRSREKGGTGLGLAIVKHIMEVHGEDFFVDSTPNVGSTFSFTLTRVNQPRNKNNQ